LNWKQSRDALPITNEFNFGTEVKTAINVKNENIPTAIFFYKIKDITLFLSRKVNSTLLRLYFLYLHGKFSKAMLEFNNVLVEL
jgi:hypothetical protein